MSFQLLSMAFALSMGAAMVCLLVGQIFALVAVPTLTENTGWKYGLLILSLVVPLLGGLVCLFHYKKTAYACKFIYASIFFGVLTLVLSHLIQVKMAEMGIHFGVPVQ